MKKNYSAKININGVMAEVYGTNPQDLIDGVDECVNAMARAINRAITRGEGVKVGYGVGGEGMPNDAPIPRGQRAMVMPTDDACSCGCGCCANCGCTQDECCCDDGYCEDEEPPRYNSPNIGNVHDVAWMMDAMARQMAIDNADADAFGHSMGYVDPMGNY